VNQGRQSIHKFQRKISALSKIRNLKTTSIGSVLRNHKLPLLQPHSRTAFKKRYLQRKKLKNEGGQSWKVENLFS
jgi:hypothetical protein